MKNIRSKIIYISIIGIVLCGVAFYVGETGRIFGAFINRLAPCIQAPQNSFPCYGAYDIGLMVVAVLLAMLFLSLLLKPNLVSMIHRAQTYFVIGAVLVIVAGGAYYCAHSYEPPTSPLSPRAVSAAKVPDGWYERFGTPPVTVAILTKQDNYVISVGSAAATGTPEQYVAQVGFAGVDADAMGLKGTWGTFRGHRMFAVDSGDISGYIVILFGNGKAYTFQLSHDDPSDATAFWQVITFYTQPEFFANTSDWKTYTDPSTGFSMQYPPQYAAEVESAPPAGWVARTLVQIYNPASTSTGEFTIGPAQVTLQKQPIIANGKIYHIIAEYQSSGVAAQMTQGASNANGQLLDISSGEQALFYPLPANPDTGTDPIDSFTFIKDDLIYYVSFDANDPNEQGMLESIAWK